MTSLLGAIVRLTESAAKGAGKMALSGAKSAAVKAFQRVGTYSNSRLRGPSANTKPAIKAPDAVRPSAIKGPSAVALVDPVAGIDQVIFAVNASSDKIARTIDEVNTELQKFLYKRRPSGGAKKSQSGEEEDEEQKDRRKPKPKIRPKAKVRPKVKPKARFRRGPKNALTKLKGRNARNALTRLNRTVPSNALSKVGSAASLGASVAKTTGKLKLGGVPGGKILGPLGTALGMYGEFADEMDTTGNVTRGAAAAAGTGVGMGLGGWGGAAAGGALGTLILPGIGTTIGAIAGGLLGGWGGGELGAAAGRTGYDAATGFTPDSKGTVGIAGESLVKINDLEYAFSNVIFESRELVFEYNKIERGRQSGAVGFGGGGGSVISVGPDGTIGRVSSGDSGGVLFGPRSGGGGSDGSDPSGVIPSNPRDATKNYRTGATTPKGESYSKQTIENVDPNDPIGSMVNKPNQPIQTRRGEPGEFNYGLTREGKEELGDPTQQRFDRAGKLVNITTKSGQTVQVHEKVADRAQGFLNELEARGYKIDSIGGYSHRANVNNPSQMSTHAYGTTLDINPSANPNKGGRTDFPAGIENLAWKYGFSWGGRFDDSMHFESMSPAARESKLKQLVDKGVITAEEAKVIRETGLPSNVKRLVDKDTAKATEQDVIKSHNQTLDSVQNPFRRKQDSVGKPITEDELKKATVVDQMKIQNTERKDLDAGWKPLRADESKPIKTEREIIEALKSHNPSVKADTIEPRPEEPARKTVDDMNVTGPPQVNTLKEKQRHSGLELNDRDDNNIYQTYTEYSNLSKVV